jgi:hypothetical protein
MECHGVCSPLEPGSSDREENSIFNSKVYREAISSLLYLANGTRPDIANAVCRQSQYCERPTKYDWANVKHILRYLKQNKNHKLLFKKTGVNI